MNIYVQKKEISILTEHQQVKHMILSAAQFAPQDGNINKNLGHHHNLIDLAYTHNVQLIVFPEMSLTGYLRENAAEYAFTLNDTRLSGLRKQARDYQITIIAGAPIKIGDQLFIGSFVIQPNNSIDIYTKHYLHTGEEVAFQPSKDFNPEIEIDNAKFALAICYDLEVEEHVNMACAINSEFYVPSIFYSKNGIAEGHTTLAKHAKSKKLNILMSNFCGKSFGVEAGGRSAFWDSNGRLIEELDESSQGLLIVEKLNDTWKGTSIFTSYE